MALTVSAITVCLAGEAKADEIVRGIRGYTPATPIPSTVVPIGIGASTPTETVVKTLRGLRAKSGMNRFVLHAPGHTVRLTGYYDAKAYRGVGRRVKAVRSAVAKEGIEVGFLMGPTMNVGINHPWQKFTYSDGRERPFTACAGDPAFQADFAKRCAAVATECKPFLYMMEDDFRIWGTGCFCKNHLARFSRATGTSWTGEALAYALSVETNTALRVAWHRMQIVDLAQVAANAERAIHAASPATRIGLSAPGGFQDDLTAYLARTLAGPRNRPLVRWWGTTYGYDDPIRALECPFSAIWAKENVSEGFDCFYEADAAPNTAFYGSGARLGACCSTVLANGFQGLWYWAAGCSSFDSGDPMPNLGEYVRSSARWAALQEAVKGGHTVGAGIAFNPLARLVAAAGATQGRSAGQDMAVRLLGRMGLPYTARRLQPSTSRLQPPTCYCGYWSFEGMSDVEIEKILSGNVFLDGDAAEQLTKRGFGNLIGVTATRRDKIDFSGESVVLPQPSTSNLHPSTSIPSSFHQNYGLDSAPVLRLKPCGAEAMSVYFSGKPENVIQPALTRFTNAMGGRVVVMAVALADCSATNVYNFRKRALLLEAFEWLGGKGVFPVRTATDVNVAVTATEKVGVSGCSLVVHCANMSCDVKTTLALEFSEDWRGASVEVLEGSLWRPSDVAWTGSRVEFAVNLPVFETLIIRLRK